MYTSQKLQTMNFSPYAFIFSEYICSSRQLHTTIQSIRHLEVILCVSLGSLIHYLLILHETGINDKDRFVEFHN